jgi:phage baseplate assembly protein W
MTPLPPRVPDGALHDPGIIGRGMRFPMAVDARGCIAMSGGPDELDGSVRVIVSTAPGERVMRPQFGCRIWDLLFEPVNANTIGLMAEAVRQAVAQWEPRVEVEDVVVTPDQDDATHVAIAVSYRIRATNDRRNLVYPFYVIPREESSGPATAQP